MPYDRLYKRSFEAVLDQSTYYMATLWMIEPIDGSATIYLTDHDVEINYLGDLYIPISGGDPSALEQKAGMKPGSQDVVGVLASSAITKEGLVGGRFNKAKITQFLCNWNVNWLGLWERNDYRLGNIKLVGQSWQAELNTRLVELDKTVGKVASAKCDYVFQKGLCTASGNEETRTVSSVTAQRYSFVLSSFGVADDNFYKDGYVEWNTGNNANIIGTIKSSDYSTKTIVLYDDMPYTIGVGDSVDLVKPCAHDFAACQSFNAHSRFGGCHEMPGMDKLISGPSTS